MASAQSTVVQLDHLQVSADIATQTPELCTCAIGSDARAEIPATGVPLFSLFRPKAQRKVCAKTSQQIAISELCDSQLLMGSFLHGKVHAIAGFGCHPAWGV
jgi:hypothetical protein